MNRCSRLAICTVFFFRIHGEILPPQRMHLPPQHGEIAQACRSFSRGVTDGSRTALPADGTTHRQSRCSLTALLAEDSFPRL